MPSYNLSIITPNGQVFNDKVDSLIAPGEKGKFGILANHAPIIISLKKGSLNLKQDQKDRQFDIGPGILEVDQQGSVLMLCDDAVPSN